MKQLLFLLLFPCLAMAQYQGNAGQKITLGEQTSADGLVWRGRSSDTANLLTNKLDTSVYIVLDTGTQAMWYYRASTTPKWTRLVDSLNNLQGTLSVAKGGTGSATQNFVDLTTTQSIGGIKTFTSAANFNSTLTTGGKITSTLGNNTVVFENTSATTGWLGFFRAVNTGGNFQLALENSDGGTRAIGTLPYSVVVGSYSETGALHLATDNNVRLTVLAGGNVGIGTASPAVQLHTTGAVRFATFAGGGTTTLSVDNTGDLARTSSIELKKDVTPIRHGLNEILQINPINFNWIDEDKFGNENENGFIAEDVMSIIPNVVASDTHGLFMDYTKLIPILTKAIQEQNALIKALEQRILILENK